jgi:hypothetical protein
MDDLSQRPAVGALREALDVFFGQKPGPMGEDLVDVVDGSQLLGDKVDAAEPLHVATLRDELLLVQADEVVALVASGGHDGQVVARRERQRAIVVHQISVRLDVVLEVLRVVADHFRDMIVDIQVSVHVELRVAILFDGKNGKCLMTVATYY